MQNRFDSAYLRGFGFSPGFEAGDGFFVGVETPKLIRRKRNPFRSESRSFTVWILSFQAVSRPGTEPGAMAHCSCSNGSLFLLR